LEESLNTHFSPIAEATLVLDFGPIPPNVQYREKTTKMDESMDVELDVPPRGIKRKAEDELLITAPRRIKVHIKSRNLQSYHFQI
jgi:hypothetical protein